MHIFSVPRPWRERDWGEGHWFLLTCFAGGRLVVDYLLEIRVGHFSMRPMSASKFPHCYLSF